MSAMTAALILVAYLAGSINFSIILFRLLGREDPRAQFSGNPGTTNVYRQAGPAWAVVVLLFDTGRSVTVALAAVHWTGVSLIPWMGLALIVGNHWPCFHGFKGGKGVANYLGFTMVISPLYAGVAALAWVIVYAVVRKPFIASFFMIFFLALGTILTIDPHPTAVTGTLLTAALIYYAHRPNLVAWYRAGKRR
jgi:acyl phosphate:glycerol-3-phosphate acyltransferase